jgi:hypothetical protein
MTDEAGFGHVRASLCVVVFTLALIARPTAAVPSPGVSPSNSMICVSAIAVACAFGCWLPRPGQLAALLKIAAPILWLRGTSARSDGAEKQMIGRQ